MVIRHVLSLANSTCSLLSALYALPPSSKEFVEAKDLIKKNGSAVLDALDAVKAALRPLAPLMEANEMPHGYEVRMNRLLEDEYKVRGDKHRYHNYMPTRLSPTPLTPLTNDHDDYRIRRRS